MRKKKIDFKKYADMHEKKEITGKDGTVIVARDHIPYTDKVEMAKEIVENYVMIHDDSCAYENYDIYAAIIRMIIKYYTNVPVDDAEDYEVADFAINNELIGQIEEYIREDYLRFEDVYLTMLRSVIDNYDDDQSLKKAVKTSFGFLFNGEDITESMAKAELTKDTLFNALDAINKKEEEAQSKMDDGRLNVGGNILNFAKRE